MRHGKLMTLMLLASCHLALPLYAHLSASEPPFDLLTILIKNHANTSPFVCERVFVLLIIAIFSFTMFIGEFLMPRVYPP